MLGIEPDDLAQQSLRALDRLTPGDFANVVRQSRLRPVRTTQDFIARLANEVKHKRLISGRPMGFLANAA